MRTFIFCAAFGLVCASPFGLFGRTVTNKGLSPNVADTKLASPVIVDVFETGDVRILAPHGWSRQGRLGVNPFSLVSFEMIPGKIGRWEWVSAKAGILVYGEGDVPPVRVTGANLFGIHTWNKFWAHGYQPLATLDVSSNGLLEGAELSNIWVWVDGNVDALPTPNEFTRADQVFHSVSVRPLEGADTYAPKGARLKSTGNWVGSWDWWSGSFVTHPDAVVAPVADSKSPVCIYRWHYVAPSTLGEVPAPSLNFEKLPKPEGYFRFGSDGLGILVASISTLPSFRLEGRVGPVFPITPSDKFVGKGEKGEKKGLAFLWTFGEMYSVAFTNSSPVLYGVTYPRVKGAPPLYYWVAFPLADVAKNGYARSLAALDFQELGVLAKDSPAFSYAPISEPSTESSPRCIPFRGVLLRFGASVYKSGAMTFPKKP